MILKLKISVCGRGNIKNLFLFYYNCNIILQALRGDAHAYYEVQNRKNKVLLLSNVNLQTNLVGYSLVY